MNSLDQLPPETGESPPTLSELLDRHPFADSEALVQSDDGPLSAGEIGGRAAALAATLRAAGVIPGQAVGNLGKLLRRELSVHGPLTWQEDR